MQTTTSFHPIRTWSTSFAKHRSLLPRERRIKKTTKQYYCSVANGIVREVFEDSSIDDHYLLLKCLMLRCAEEFSDLHREVGLERMNKRQFDAAAQWISDQGKIAAAAELLAGVEMGEEDWMVP